MAAALPLIPTAGGDWDILVIDAQDPAPPTYKQRGRRLPAQLVARRALDLLRVQPRRNHADLETISRGGDPVQVTKDGGNQPFESPDGRFLYFE
jgi:hypothetical protein